VRRIGSYISESPSNVDIIRAMDEIGDTVCSVVDSTKLCWNTHPDREYVEEANKATIRIHEYLHVRRDLPVDLAEGALYAIFPSMWKLP
ncbi:hypothetical protein C5167_020645, partial [Papaver somniferum]